MPNVCIMIPASPTVAFYSQIAAIELALSKLRWTRWEPQVHVSFGGDFDPELHARWAPYLRNTRVSLMPKRQHEREDDWAQCDDVVRMTPCDADIVLDMDADTLPVADFEGILDQVHADGCISGVMAHYPPGGINTQQWSEIAQRVAGVSLDFNCNYSLVDPAADLEKRLAPFYLNFGVVFFPGTQYDRLAREFLRLRPLLMAQLEHSQFAAQVALTLAAVITGAQTRTLPMRYNYPNDPTADRLYPEELQQVTIFHYLRLNAFDRHRIFTSAAEYTSFLNLDLTGSNKVFQDAVRRLIGPEYPF